MDALIVVGGVLGVGLAVGFAAGFGLRHWMSQQRRRRYLER